MLSKVSKESEGSNLGPYVAKRRNSSAVLILQEFEVKKCSLATGKTAEDFVPAALALITYCFSVLEVYIWDVRPLTVSELHVLQVKVSIVLSLTTKRKHTMCFKGKSSSGSSFNPTMM